MERIHRASKDELDLAYYSFINKELRAHGFVLDKTIDELKKILILRVLQSNAVIVAMEVTCKELANPKIKKFNVGLDLGEASRNLAKEDATLASAGLVSYLKFFKDLIDSYSSKSSTTMNKSDLPYYKRYFEKRVVKRVLS